MKNLDNLSSMYSQRVIFAELLDLKKVTFELLVSKKQPDVLSGLPAVTRSAKRCLTAEGKLNSAKSENAFLIL